MNWFRHIMMSNLKNSFSLERCTTRCMSYSRVTPSEEQQMQQQAPSFMLNTTPELSEITMRRREFKSTLAAIPRTIFYILSVIYVWCATAIFHIIEALFWGPTFATPHITNHYCLAFHLYLYSTTACCVHTLWCSHVTTFFTVRTSFRIGFKTSEKAASYLIDSYLHGAIFKLIRQPIHTSFVRSS